MTRKTTTRMLGCAEYEASWVDSSQMVQLVARGFLPCANHQAQLERGAAGGWELVFYTQENTVESYTPFNLQAYVMVGKNAEAVLVKDALGVHEITIRPAPENPEETDSRKHIVYARKTAIDVPEEVYFTQPVGTQVLPIYTHAFGPASKADCTAFIASANDRFMKELDEIHAKIERIEEQEGKGLHP